MSGHGETRGTVSKKRRWIPSNAQAFALLAAIVGVILGWALGGIQSELLWLLPLAFGAVWYTIFFSFLGYPECFGATGIFLVALFCGVVCTNYLGDVEPLFMPALYWFGFAGLGAVVVTFTISYVDYRLWIRQNPWGD